MTFYEAYAYCTSCFIIRQYVLLLFYEVTCVFVKGGQKMYSVFEKLLQKYGISTYKVSKETGIAQSVFSSWKNGISTPKQDKMQKIADYFHVSVEYLITGEEKEGGEKYYLNDETADIAQQIFENKELKVLFDAAKDAQPEDLGTVYQMLLALKRKERGEDN